MATTIYKGICALIALICTTSNLIGQPVNNRIKSAIQPTPIATEFGKYSDIPVSLGSGLANVTVPLYELKYGPLSLPLYLSYHSAGVKVGELASWVGLNWSLNTGGVVSRTTLGIPDEEGSGYWIVGTQYSAATINTYKADIANGLRDGEPDLFSFTAGEYSGKFFIDKNHVVRQIPIQDVKIEVVGVLEGFVITPPNGVRYIYGKIPSTSTLLRETSKGSNESNYYPSSFYLMRMESQDAKYQINYNYVDDDYSYKSLATCKYERKFGCSDLAQEVCAGTQGADAYHYYVINKVKGKRLASITYPLGTITFTGSTAARADVDANNETSTVSRYLTRIDITCGSYCKRFDFFHSYFEDDTSPSFSTLSEAKRLKLDSLREGSCNSAIVLPYYKFEYNGTVKSNGRMWLPYRLHKGIDHWGYYNGATGNEIIKVIVPPTKLTIGSAPHLYGTADRQSSYTYMLPGSLKKVVYPTGGNTSFTYEGNTVDTNMMVVGSKFVLNNCNSPLDSACCGVKLITGNSAITASDISNGHFRMDLVQAQGTSCTSATYINVVVRAYLGTIEMGSRVYNISSGSGYYQAPLTELGITSPNTYRFEMTTTDGWSKFEIFGANLTPTNLTVGGLRIKEIRTNDGSGSTTNDIIRTYDYFDEATPTKSSGKLLKNIQYGYSVPLSPIGVYVWAGESIVPNGGYEGYHLGYAKIRENVNQNGKIIWSFFQKPYYYTYSSSEYPFPPHSGDLESGRLLNKTTFSQSNVQLRQESYAYSKSNHWTEALNAIWKASNIICYSPESGNFSPPYPNNYYATSYIINVHGVRTTQETITQDGVTTTKTFEYDGSSRHMAPVAINFTNSNSKVIREEIKYPYDMAAGAVKDTLINRNILAPMVTIRKVNNLRVDGDSIVYSLFDNTGSGYQVPVASGGHPYPASDYRFEMTWVGTTPQAGSYALKGTYNQYDLNGNIKQYTQVNWQPETYTWENGLIKTRTFQGYAWSYTYHTGTRLLSTLTEIDGQVTNYYYDALMRLDSMRARAGNVTAKYQYQYKNASNTYNWIKTTQRFTAATNSAYTLREIFAYSDGLGRPLQSVDRKHSPAQKDVIKAQEYDNQGRLSKSYEVFESANNTGAYVTVPGGTPHTVTAYEASPLSRVTSVIPPSWYATTTAYAANVASEVGYADNASATSYYAANSLAKTTVTDPNNNKTITFTDKKGRVVAIRRTDNPGTNSIWTYHLYDDKDRTTRVLPPGATPANTELIFDYTYDGADRMLSKKIPAQAIINYKYNNRDLPTYLQDGNLLAAGQWLNTQYDLYGRTTTTGLYTGTPANGDFVPGTLSPTLSTATYGTTGINIGKVTAETKNILTTANNLSYSYTYDSYGRVGNLSANNHLNTTAGSEAVTYTYDFADNKITENRAHQPAAGTTYTINQTWKYDHAGRDTAYYHSLNGNQVKVRGTVYDWKDQVSEKNLGAVFSGGVNTYLQSVDYTYNAQGWLTRINGSSLSGTNLAWPTTNFCALQAPNPGASTLATDPDPNDLFYLELSYDVLLSGITGLTGTIQKNGNIAQQVWRVRGRDRQANSYAYDYLDRLGTATFFDINGSNAATANNTFHESLTYDVRGNISTLNRNGFYQNGGTCGYGAIDQLTYTYTAGTNRLAALADAAPTTNNQRSFGFNPGAGGAGYGYDNNGNLKTDTYKGITNLAYNHLNLPNQAVWSGKTIDFLYDAGGTLLRRTVKTGANTDLVQDYSMGVEYRTAGGNPRRLEAVYHAEGRRFNVNVKSSNTESIRQEYWLRDHLGNTRISFTDKNNDGKIDVTNTSSNEILSEQHYYPFGMAYEGPVWINDTADVDNRYKYTGKEFQAEHGLNWYAHGARYYDPMVGRFMGVDPLADHPNQVDKSPYSAFWNNPIMYDDPDGQCPFCPWLDAVVDVGFVLYDVGVLIHEKVTTGSTSGANWAALGADGASILVPMSVGAGAAVRAGVKAVNKVDNAVDVAKTTSKVVENAKQGKQFEGVVTDNLKQTGHKNVAEQVTVKPNGGGKNVRLDNVSTKDGNVKLTDAKSSATAPYTKNQKTGYPAIEKSGGTVVGNKGRDFGYPHGTKIPPTKVDIVRPKDIKQ